MRASLRFVGKAHFTEFMTLGYKKTNAHGLGGRKCSLVDHHVHGNCMLRLDLGIRETASELGETSLDVDPLDTVDRVKVALNLCHRHHSLVSTMQFVAAFLGSCGACFKDEDACNDLGTFRNAVLNVPEQGLLRTGPSAYFILVLCPQGPSPPEPRRRTSI